MYHVCLFVCLFYCFTAHMFFKTLRLPRDGKTCLGTLCAQAMVAFLLFASHILVVATSFAVADAFAYKHLLHQCAVCGGSALMANLAVPCFALAATYLALPWFGLPYVLKSCCVRQGPLLVFVRNASSAMLRWLRGYGAPYRVAVHIYASDCLSLSHTHTLAHTLVGSLSVVTLPPFVFVCIAS